MKKRTKKLSLDPETLAVQSFEPLAPSAEEGTVLAFEAASETACQGTLVCTCDFTACCHH